MCEAKIDAELTEKKIFEYHGEGKLCLKNIQCLISKILMKPELQTN